MKQRVTEWMDVKNKDYHEKQILRPYRSTEKFVEWLMELGKLKTTGNENSEMKILDVGCGKGGNVIYLGKKFPKFSFFGMNINKELVDEGNSIILEQNL
ncbi:MAG: hypothetical protein HQM08_10265 [Candidatus Riflebacteria bacterium]|nr:hypothetical protein [Candidatus Riflebacteria bacterium]